MGAGQGVATMKSRIRSRSSCEMEDIEGVNTRFLASGASYWHVRPLSQLNYRVISGLRAYGHIDAKGCNKLQDFVVIKHSWVNCSITSTIYSQIRIFFGAA